MDKKVCIDHCVIRHPLAIIYCNGEPTGLLCRFQHPSVVVAVTEDGNILCASDFGQVPLFLDIMVLIP